MGINRKFYATSLLIFSLLLGCTDKLDVDLDLPDSTNSIELSGRIQQEYISRANDDGFANGDNMGIYIVDYNNGQPAALTAGDNRASNAKFQFDGQKWATTGSYYWKDETSPVDVYGYYPYVADIYNVNDFQVEVMADQRATDDGTMSGYEKSDILWAKTSGVTQKDGVIILNYTHRMAGVLVKLTKGEGITDTEWSKVKRDVVIKNTIRYASVDLANGSVTPIGQIDKDIITADQGEDSYRAVVVPQHIDQGTNLISITIDGTSYIYTRTEGLDLQSGKLHKFTLRIDKKADGDFELTLVGQEITPWENDNISHNFIEREYTVITTTEPGALKSTIEALGKDYRAIKCLKIIGFLNHEDFYFMRDEMDNLNMLNLKEVKCKDYITHWDEENECDVEEYFDDYIPNYALAGKKSLRRLILPDGITWIGVCAFMGIGLDVNSTLILPKHLKRIDGSAFAGIGEAGELILNDELEYIGEGAFVDSEFVCELNLPNTLKYIGNAAFGYTYALHHLIAKGHFQFPENLEYLGAEAFSKVSFDEVGDVIFPDFITNLTPGMMPSFTRGTYIKLPANLKVMEDACFGGTKILNHIELPEGITRLDREAFYCSNLAGGITLPSSLRELGTGTFAGCHGLEDLVLPSGLVSIPEACFNGSSVRNIVLPDNIVQIEDCEAFANSDLQSIQLGKYFTYIGRSAFGNCYQLSRIVCLNPEPPTLGGYGDSWDNPFAGVDFNRLVLEVPEESVDLYRNTPGWKDIRFITPHHELAVNIQALNCLEGGITVEGMVRSEGKWTVAECPDWCHVSPTTSDDRSTDIVITVDPTSPGNAREGKIIFKLNDKQYTTDIPVNQYAYQYPQDQVIDLHTGTKGDKNINVLFVGEAYDADEIVEGKYMQDVNEAYEHFFSIEPFRTYKDYFTAQFTVACSAESGPNHKTMFDLSVSPLGIGINYDKLKEYGWHVLGNDLSHTLIVCIANYDAFAGNIDIEGDDMIGMVMACRTTDTYPYDFRGIIQHYACGSAFGQLAPEYVTHYEFIKGCTCPGCSGLTEYNKGVARGWYGNVSLNGGLHSVPWEHLIFDPRYSDIVDVYEGAYKHLRGVYRSENMSCMSSYIDYFNTISRELIVRRIKTLAGEDFDFEDFVAHDSREGIPTDNN